MAEPLKIVSKLEFEDAMRTSVIDNEMRADYYWYLEGVEVDTYIKEESRFDVTIEILRIKLPLVPPLAKDKEFIPGLSEKVFELARKKDEPILLDDILKKVVQVSGPVARVYSQYYPFVEQFHRRFVRYQEGDPHSLVAATYIVETLLKFEPSMVSLFYIGDFLTYNLNWLISKLNQNRILINLELDTVEYLINRCDKLEAQYARDEKYQALSALFLHKARYEY